jgi:Family of unknown function (DUF5372)
MQRRIPRCAFRTFNSGLSKGREDFKNASARHLSVDFPEASLSLVGCSVSLVGLASNRFLPGADPIPRQRFPSVPSLKKEIEKCRPRVVCNSIQNASASIAATRLVRITHPFHPLSGRQLPCVGERYNRYGMTPLPQIDDESVCSVPPQWTELVAVDPEIATGGHRALFRVVDLLELAGLIDR